MKPWIARVLALVLTVLPWVSNLAQARPNKTDTALSGPQTPQSVFKDAAPTTGTPPMNGLSWFAWQPQTPTRPKLQRSLVGLIRAPEARTPRYLECAKLQLDGG